MPLFKQASVNQANISTKNRCCTSLILKIRWIVCLLLLINWTSSWSEVTLDGSMGPSGAVNLQNNNYEITEQLGTRAGSNLFHSFGQFNLSQNQSATFSGSPDIQNVIGRVTGGMPSNIDGTLRSTIPNASLYFLNPAGVLFGENASLDVQGSFHVSTANYLGLEDGNQFSTSLQNINQILTTASPEAFGFLGDNTGAITVLPKDGMMEQVSKNGLMVPVSKDALMVPKGKNFSLIGGDILLAGGKLVASAGRIDIASVNSEGEVIRQGNDLQLKGFQKLGKIELNQTALVDASGERGGAIFIRGGELIINNSLIISETTGNYTGKTVDINVPQGYIEMQNNGLISTITSGYGNGGNIRVKTDKILLSGKYYYEASGILTFTNFKADAGDITVLSDTIDMQAWGIILSDSATDIKNNADFDERGSTGSILVESGIVRMYGDGLLGGSFIATSAIGSSKNISVISNSLEMRHGAGISMRDIGNAGDLEDIIIKADNLVLQDSAIFYEAAFDSTDDLGELIIEAKDILLTGYRSGFSSPIIFQFNDVRAANLTIDTTNLEVRDGAQINVKGSGVGNGGDLLITAKNILLTGDRSGIFGGENGITSSNALTNNNSNAQKNKEVNKIQLFSENLEVRNGAVISSNANGAKKGGDIRLAVKNVILSGDGAKGTGLFSSASDIGDAGQIIITDNDSLILDNAIISVDSTGSNAGNIIIATNKLIDLRNSEITTSVDKDKGSGGNISIGQQIDRDSGVLTPDLIVLDNSKITAQAAKGSGGKIDITSDLIFKSGSSVVDASSSEGEINGTVNINSPETNLSGSLVALPEAYFSASDHLSAHCSARAAKVSSFVIKDRDVVPPGPDDAASSIFYGDDAYQNLSEDQLSAASPDPVDLNHPRNINNGVVIAKSGCDE